MIYCVEDDDAIRELMVYTLEATGFTAKGFPDGEAFWQGLTEELPELILLDIMLPGSDGLSILQELRGKGATQDIPVIMATAKGTEVDKVKGLDMGADDYLVKPFGMMEMVSRIKAVLRRIQKPDRQTLIKTGDLILDLQNYSLTKAGQVINLTLKEFDLLALFMQHPNRVFSRQELLDRIWGEQFLGETRTVDVHIGTLRTKLDEASEFIQTVRGVGYRWEQDHD